VSALIGISIVAAVATAADFVWYEYGVEHRMASGLIHGVALLAAVGGVLGAASGRTLRGLPIGAIAGLGGALSYYALVAMFDRRTYGSAIPIAWVLTWIYLAALDGRWLRRPNGRPWREIVTRGMVAALCGGLAFYLVMNVLWGRPPATGRNYLVQFLAWAFAWAPGLLALTAGGRRRRSIAASPAQHSGLDVTAFGTPVESGDEPEEGAVTPEALLARIDRGEQVHILDVRFEGEFAAGRVPGAVNIPFMQVSSKIAFVPGGPDEELVVYCGHGPRAYMAGAALRRAGRSRIVYMTGHWAGWQAAGLRVER
jgi:rhodanese-related sulfurtransferase